MRRESSGPILTTIFVDYDNIYLSLRRKSEEAAKRFSKDAGLWVRELESGRLITPTNGIASQIARRIVMNRCYGNPVPRRNSGDNSTDMNSFPFVRHHFLRTGFEVVDCPPLTQQMKNSSDIRMVMDIRDLIGHDTYFDEFIILSGDADFTPVLHRLRAHARRTVIFANDNTVLPYTSLADGEVRESDLISLLLEGRIGAEAEANNIEAPPVQERLPSPAQIDALRRELIAEVAALVRQAGQPVPLEALADRLVRTLGHDRTVGSGWGGTGSFRDLLVRALPSELRLSSEPPYYVFDATPAPAAETTLAPQTAAPAAPLAYAAPRDLAPQPAPVAREMETQGRIGYGEPRTEQRFEPAPQRLVPAAQPVAAPAVQAAPIQPAPQPQIPAPQRSHQQPAPASVAREPFQPVAPAAQQAPRPAAPAAPPQAPRGADSASAIQQSIARIHEACQAPPLSPPEYRALFEAMAAEIGSNGLAGAQTLANIAARAAELGIEIRRDDIRFVLEVVSEADPWFEQGASPVLFSSRFRNFVVARCRSQGLNLSADELDLIEAWFAATPGRQQSAPAPQPQAAVPQRAAAPQQPQQAAASAAGGGDRWWTLDEGRQHVAEQRGGGDDFPRFVRKGLRG